PAVEHVTQTAVFGAAPPPGPAPPGPATLIAERPKLVVGATASTFSHGPFTPAAAVGAVAETQITCTPLQNLHRSWSWSRSDDILPAAATRTAPLRWAQLSARLIAAIRPGRESFLKSMNGM